jgi:Tol biopolymer transport system component
MHRHSLARVGIARSACVLALAIAADGCGDSSTSGKPPFSDARIIALVSDSANPDGRSIFVMHADGSHRTRLTTPHFHDMNPFWSPDGSSITFESSRPPSGIWIMNADGGNQRPFLTDAAFGSPTYLHWSPDGHFVAFDAYADEVSNRRVIMIADSDGSHAHRLTSNLADERWPSWSPDGSMIAFMMISGPLGYSIFVANRDGTGQRQLTNDFGWMPEWSPDGTHIAFVSLTANLSTQIFVMREDGSDRRALTTGASDLDPAWSPDGQQLAYDRTTDDSTSHASNGPEEIFRINSNGRAARQITSTGFTPNTFSRAWSPSWKPAP